MLLRDLTKVYISEYKEIEDHGESEKVWKYKGKAVIVEDVNDIIIKELDKKEVRKLASLNNRGIAWLNMQCDISELDRKPTGEVDYSTYKGRTTKDYDIQKGDGISFEDISKSEEFVPQYKVTDKNKIGNTYVYICEKVQ